MIKEIPILFSTPMVKSIEEETKNITRRTTGLKKINVSPDKWKISLIMQSYTNSKGYHEDRISVLFTHKGSAKQICIPCPYGKAGEVLWIRETWNSYNENFYGLPSKEIFLYKANGTDRTCTWKPSIFMPKEACRFFLKIKNIGIERLHDITEKDAIAEGVESYKDITDIIRFKDYYSDASGYGDPKQDYPSFSSANESFKSLWIKINGKRSWDKNPWVWVIKFNKMKTSKDKMKLNQNFADKKRQLIK